MSPASPFRWRLRDHVLGEPLHRQPYFIGELELHTVDLHQALTRRVIEGKRLPPCVLVDEFKFVAASAAHPLVETGTVDELLELLVDEHAQGGLGRFGRAVLMYPNAEVPHGGE